MHSHKSKYWIVVANASKLKLFSCEHGLHKIKNDLTLIEEINHDASRLKMHDLTNDRPGHYAVDLSDSRSAYEYKTDAKELEKIHFAKEIANLLEQAKHADKYEKLIIIAHDHFYGILKAHCDPAVLDAIYQTIPKDYSSFSKEDLAIAILNE